MSYQKFNSFSLEKLNIKLLHAPYFIKTVLVQILLAISVGFLNFFFNSISLFKQLNFHHEGNNKQEFPILECSSYSSDNALNSHIAFLMSLIVFFAFLAFTCLVLIDKLLKIRKQLTMVYQRKYGLESH